MDKKNVEKTIKDIVLMYSEELKKVLKIEGVYIFGSYAKGTFNAESDIDVLIVSSDFTGDIIEDMQLVMKLRRKIDRRIEPHILEVKEFLEGNPFIEQIKNEMIKIA